MSLRSLRGSQFGVLVLVSLATIVRGQEGTGLPGERLAPETFGPSSVETMDAMAARVLPEKVGGRLAGRSYGHVPGTWFVPPARATWIAHSGRRYVINQHGDPRIGIGFPGRVSVEGAWVAPQGDVGTWARGVIAHGCREGVPVARTGERRLDSRTPVHLEMCFDDVDRIVFEATSDGETRAFFALDDLTFRAGATRVTLDFESLSERTDLTGTSYGNLTWEVGTGYLDEDVRAVPPPYEPRTADRELPGVPAPPGEAMTGVAPRVVRQIDGPRIFEPGNAVIPPDTNGAAGPTHYVALVNGSFNVYDRATGQRTHQVPIRSFWNVSGGLGDVRIVFDPHAQRFVALCMDGNARLYLALSMSADPTGAWFKSSILASQGVDATRWPDFPTLGVDARGIYTAALMVGNGDPITLWAIDKAPLLQNPPSLGTVTAWRGLAWEGAVQPCLTHGDPGVEYLVSRLSNTQLRVRRVVPPLTAPTLWHVGFVTVPAHARAPSAPARGGQVGIATGDWRPSNAVYRDGVLYTTQTIDVAGRAGVRWYAIDVATATLAQQGTIADPTWHYYHGSIAANRHGDVVVGCSGSHANAYASAFLTGRRATDPPGAMADPLLYQQGLASYVRVDGNGTNRFGDYSLTGVDPADDESFWTIQEYVFAQDSWGTNVAHVRFSCARALPYGQGLAGTLGEPTLTPVPVPLLGRTFALFLSNSLGAPTQGALLFGVRRANLPLFGGTLLVEPPGLPIPVTLPSTSAFLPFAIPNDRSLLCVPFHVQGWVFDPGAVQGIAMTAGLELQIGE